MQAVVYSEVVREIESRGVMPEGPPSLEVMKQGLLGILPGLEIDGSKVIVVAGTNGKGSVCATLEALLIAAGESVGLYTSPHLEETTERIRINGKDISQEAFCRAYDEVQKRTQDIRLSHFEILTLMAAWVFFSEESFQPLDRFIFEVGLGGTWDATNAIPHDFCVITSLGHDHQNLLGNTLEEIALNKFGIVGPGATVVHSPLPEEIKSLADKICHSTQSQWTESVPFSLEVCETDHLPSFILNTKWGKAPLALPGRRAGENTATALTVFQELGYDPAQYLSVLSQVRWPGRMERVQDLNTICPVYLSGDHNPQGIESLLEILEYYPRRHLSILVGIGRDKDLEGILTPLFNLKNASIYLTETPFRGRPLDSYGPWLERAKGAWSDPVEALQRVLGASKADDMVLITGSLYLVGFMKRQLRGMTQ